MGALAAKQTLIPVAAGLDIGHADQRLWFHMDLVPIFNPVQRLPFRIG
jgi:hypothetical protein